jgi:hypothetical protein
MFSINNGSRFAIILLSLGVIGATTASASPHPRRVEVNARVTVQKWRINQAEMEGKLSPAQAAVLHTDDRDIRKEERFDAKLDSGHITKAEQRALNQQENAVSKKIP